MATPADAALVMSLGAEAVFVGSGIFKSEDPARTAAAIVKATARYREPAVVVEASRETGAPMRGTAFEELTEADLLQGEGGMTAPAVGVLAQARGADPRLPHRLQPADRGDG